MLLFSIDFIVLHMKITDFDKVYWMVLIAKRVNKRKLSLFIFDERLSRCEKI